MALDFPSSPALGATYASGGSIWKWDGAKWAQSALAANALIVAPPLAASWTPYGSSPTVADVANGVSLSCASVTANTVRGMIRAAPAAPYAIDVNLASIGMVITADYSTPSIGWSDGVKMQFLNWVFQGNTVLVTSVAVQQYANSTTAGAVSTAYYLTGASAGNLWGRLTDDGTNVTWSVSMDGVTFVPVYATTKAAGYLGASGYTQAGVFNNALGGAGAPNQVTTLQSWRVH